MVAEARAPGAEAVAKAVKATAMAAEVALEQVEEVAQGLVAVGHAVWEGCSSDRTKGMLYTHIANSDQL
eukprot:CAMPEP_0195604814 /NCGR_PEP_ID=MMETSP0815-20121206/6836_1 /TAXON_ID=97485 /ORGANISM="Prymnesium parvum, Strain Texoma1" /LENGTH=68 /DNA_ID=CAMNT_0040744481 /DNA_START=862 /DNA_END=1068 /DNA_ORIENTATION=+